MTGIDATIDGSSFVRARRNLVLLSAFLFVYLSGTLDFKEDINFLGLVMKQGSEPKIELWLLVFLCYFIWRYHASLNGNSPLNKISSLANLELNTLTEKLAIQEAGQRAQNRNDVTENLSANIKLTKETKIPIWIFTATAPEFRLSVSALSAKNKHSTVTIELGSYCLTPEQTKKFFIKYAKEHIVKYNHFSEVIWPYGLSYIAYVWLTAHISYSLVL